MTQLDYDDFLQNPFLIEFFKESNLKEILRIENIQLNEIENIAFEFFTELWLDNAEGEQLDVLGIHLDWDRNGRTDEQYRSQLKAKAKINVSSGEPEAIISIIRDLFGALDVKYIPNYPAGFIIEQDAGIDFFIQEILALENDDQMGLENGDILEVQLEDIEATNLIYSAIPAGVEIIIRNFDELILENGDNLSLENDDNMAVIT